MKKLILLTTIIALFFCSCAKNTTTELTAEQKEVIISEVKQVFEYTLGGIENRDAERAFRAFSKNEGTKIIQEGRIITDLDAEEKEYAKGFSNPGSKTKITCDPLFFDIFDANTVLVTTIGSIASVEKADPNENLWVIAYTMLFRKETEGWKLYNMHMSWQ